MKDVAKNVIDRINRDVGTDIKNLYHCKDISSEYAKRVGEIEAEVSCFLLSFRETSSFASCLDEFVPILF